MSNQSLTILAAYYNAGYELWVDDKMKTTDATEAHYKDVKPSDWGRTALYVAIGMLVIVAGAVFLLDVNHVVGGVLVLVLAGVVLATLITWHAKTFAYRCTKCGEEFSISPLKDLLSLQGVDTKGGWKYLTCPRCHARERAEVIKKVK